MSNPFTNPVPGTENPFSAPMPPDTVSKATEDNNFLVDLTQEFVKGFVEGTSENVNSSMDDQAVIPGDGYAVSDNPFTAPVPDGRQMIPTDSLDFDGSEIAEGVEIDDGGSVIESVANFLGSFFE